MPAGELHHSAKLTEQDVRVIRELYRMGLRQREIGRHFPVSYVTIFHVVHNKSWRHVQ